MKLKRLTIIGIFMVSLLILAGCSNKGVIENLSGQEITIFKTPSCGCCGVYTQYMNKEGFKVSIKEMMDLGQIKSNFKIPANLQSCHTAKIGDYFVEGHMPMEAIAKLFTDKPDIAGIAMSGMPSGSPGMPGKKSGSWTIYGVNHDGTYQEFMTL